MPNLNRVMLMGNLTRDPELRYLPSNTAVVSLGLAINRRWRNQQGESQEETTFVDCESFGRQAEVINQYLRKGRPIFIEGRLKLDQWQDRDGNNRSKLKVIVERFEFIDSRPDGDGDGGGGGGGGGQQDSSPPLQQQQQNQQYSSPPQNATPGTTPGAPQGAPPGTSPGAGAPLGDPHQPVPEQDIPF